MKGILARPEKILLTDMRRQTRPLGIDHRLRDRDQHHENARQQTGTQGLGILQFAHSTQKRHHHAAPTGQPFSNVYHLNPSEMHPDTPNGSPYKGRNNNRKGYPPYPARPAPRHFPILRLVPSRALVVQ